MPGACGKTMPILSLRITGGLSTGYATPNHPTRVRRVPGVWDDTAVIRPDLIRDPVTARPLRSAI